MKTKEVLNKVIKDFSLETYLSKPNRESVEDFTPSLINDPSFNVAKDLDNNGRWRESSNHYHTLFANTKDPLQKAEAYIGYAQSLINLVKYIKAKNFLKEQKDDVISKLDGWNKTFYEARVFEKLGWINDYLGEADEAISNFSRAINLLSEKSKIDSTVLRVYETSNHFLGRQYAILAWQGKDVEMNSLEAIERFKESIKIYEKLRKVGWSDDAAEGFQYAWIARMHILQGKFIEAEKDLAKMKELFTKAVIDHPDSGVLGYYHLILGRLNFETGNYQKARENFVEALRINTEVVNHPSSQADAFLGIALCDFSLGEKEKSKDELVKALTLNPGLLYRGYI